MRILLDFSAMQCPPGAAGEGMDMMLASNNSARVAPVAAAALMLSLDELLLGACA